MIPNHRVLVLKLEVRSRQVAKSPSPARDLGNILGPRVNQRRINFMHVVDAEENKRRHESRNWGDILCRFPGRKLVRGTLPCRCKAAATYGIAGIPCLPDRKREYANVKTMA